MFEIVLRDRVLSTLAGLVGLVLLWPLMVFVAILIRLSSYGTVFSLMTIPDESGRSVLCFACDGPLGDFLKSNSLHVLPAIFDMSLGRITLLELTQIEWRE